MPAALLFGPANIRAYKNPSPSGLQIWAVDDSNYSNLTPTDQVTCSADGQGFKDTSGLQGFVFLSAYAYVEGAQINILPNPLP